MMVMRKILKIALVLLSVWLLLSVVWFAWSRITYLKYCDGMEQNYVSNFIVPRYYRVDGSYTSFVKFPDYLSLTGNLAVSANDDAESVQAFLIWPKTFGDSSYGLMIADGEEGYQIYTDSTGAPLDEQYRELVEKYEDDVSRIVGIAQEAFGDSLRP